MDGIAFSELQSSLWLDTTNKYIETFPKLRAHVTTLNWKPYIIAFNKFPAVSLILSWTSITIKVLTEA